MEVKRARKETAQLRNEVLSSIKGVQDELKELKKRTFQIKGGEFQVSSKRIKLHPFTSHISNSFIMHCVTVLEIYSIRL